MKAEILFICKGNVGRSQMAEAFYNALQEKMIAKSAGIEDVVKKYNGHLTEEIIQVMRERGIDVSGQRMKQVTLSMLRRAKEIVVLCKDEEIPEKIKQEFGKKMIIAFIKDPFGMGIEETRKIRNEVKNIVNDIIRKQNMLEYKHYEYNNY